MQVQCTFGMITPSYFNQKEIALQLGRNRKTRSLDNKWQMEKVQEVRLHDGEACPNEKKAYPRERELAPAAASSLKCIELL